MTFSLTEALQFAGIIPCVFIILALFVISKEKRLIAVPVFYFVLLAVSFSLPLQEGFDAFSWQHRLHLASLFLEATLPVASYLVIMQFLLGRPPPALYWLSLAIPFIGGAPFIYSATMASDLCVFGDVYCGSTDDFHHFYALFTSAFLFLLLVATFSRVEADIKHEDVNRSHKYWLIISLIVMNLVILVSMLAELAGRISHNELMQVQVIVKLTFIYLVMTSVFRVFGNMFALQMPLPSQSQKMLATSDVDPQLIARLEAMLKSDNLHRKMGFTREDLAKRLGVGEHVISKAINRYYEMNFNELINSYRVEEAKERLKNEDATITVIAFEVGFSSIASFNRVFKQKAGVSPTEYRNQHSSKK